MAFTINLFNFSKKENSTAIPDSADATSFSCTLKNESGLINPTIELDLGLVSAPYSYNYAYIPKFNRYYWISEWVNQYPLWTCSLKVDVLASYRSAIGNSNLYALRASAVFDGNIVDTLYPSKTSTTRGVISIDRPFQENPALGGYYVCGIVTNDEGVLSGPYSRYGSLSYVILNKNGLRRLVDVLLDVDFLETFGLNDADASLELQKSLIDPLQYIKSAVWFPIEPPTLHPLTLPVNGWPIENVEYGLLQGSPRSRAQVTITLPKHPNTSSRGNFLNTNPYSHLWLDCQPYGVIELDTSITANLSSITLIEDIDMISGKSMLTIKGGDVIISKHAGQAGVPIQLTQISRDYAGMVGSLFGGAVGAIGAGGGLGAVSSLAGGIGNAIMSYMPKSQSFGGNGGFMDNMADWSLNYEFFIPVDDDNTHNGRPYCRNVKPSTLGGYFLIQDGDVSANGTEFELSEIKRYLESGFYYE